VGDFSGIVRADDTGHGVVRAIEFTAYRDLAERSIAEAIHRIVRETGADEILRVHLEHALGTVPVGASPILIVAGSRRRAAAFRVCEAILEAVKSDAAIYGKEITDGVHDRWKRNT
jgi:molybdopterin synthase catalytic subunit